ncbi:MAG: hypothetical protein ACJAZ3_000482 [Sphingobacteriales bacterium]|jgi:hypothetical protein
MRKFLILLLVASFSMISFSQRFSSELVFGINSSHINGDELVGWNKAGIMTGVTSKFKINDVLSTRIEILYSQKGSRRAMGPDDPILDLLVYKVNVIEVPFMLDYTYIPKFHLISGFSLGNIVTARRLEGNADEDLSPTLLRFDYGYIIGTTYELSDQFSASAKFTTSLFAFNDSGTTKLKNHVLSLYLSYNLIKSKK